MQITVRGYVIAALLILGWGHFRLQGQAMPQNFVSVAPCRIADTRTSNGGAGPIAGGTYRNFTIAGLCGVPSSAAAFSLNVTAVPPGALTFLSVLPAPSSPPSGPPSSSTLNDPSGTIVANAAIVPAGNGGAITVYVSNKSDVILDVDGYFVDQTNSSTQNTALGTQAGGSTGTFNTAVGYDALPSGSGGNNTAVGAAALHVDSGGSNNSAFGLYSLYSNTGGSNNSAFGLSSLHQNTTADFNSAFGFDALSSNTTGVDNSAFGAGSLIGNATGAYNSAFGYYSLQSSDASYNSAFGYQALSSVTSATDNAAFGYRALAQSTGVNNVALGSNAGYYVTSGSDNIHIGNSGKSADTSIIRIGTVGTQIQTFIAGIYGTGVSGSTVLVNSSGQLGVQSSSIRFKEDVHEMGDSTAALMQLRPVEFRYKEPAEDGRKPVQFGLIAEEVAKVYPELVVRGKDGQVDSVQYHQLPAMLLNEIQKQHRTIQELKDANARLEAEMAQLRALLMSK